MFTGAEAVRVFALPGERAQDSVADTRLRAEAPSFAGNSNRNLHSERTRAEVPERPDGLKDLLFPAQAPSSQ